jgi:hypothetical protein
MKVKLTKGIVDADLIKKNSKSVWVRLPDGNIIKRANKHIMDKKEYILCADSTERPIG